MNISKCNGNLKEWIEYHLLFGVEHFYLFGNESTNGLAEIPESYVKVGIVTYN